MSVYSLLPSETEPTYSLTVRVVDWVRGSPIPGAFVQLEALFEPVHTGFTDEDGYVVFFGLPDDEYICYAAARGYRSTWEEFPNSFPLNGNMSITVALTPMTMESCDASGIKKDCFAVHETVYVKADGFRKGPSSFAPSDLDPWQHYIYVVKDVNWSDGMAIPPRVLGTATTVRQNVDGEVRRTPVWNSPLTPGCYDIIIDVNGDGFYNAGYDLLDDNNIAITAGFLVIPEYYGTVLGLSAFFVALGVLRLSRWKKPIFPIKRVRARLK